MNERLDGKDELDEIRSEDDFFYTRSLIAGVVMQAVTDLLSAVRKYGKDSVIESASVFAESEKNLEICLKELEAAKVYFSKSGKDRKKKARERLKIARVNFVNARDSFRLHESRGEAYHWIFSDSKNNFGFVWCCEAINLVPDSLRSRVFVDGLITEAKAAVKADSLKMSAYASRHWVSASKTI